MRKSSNALNWGGYLGAFLGASLVVVAGQLTKAWIRANLALGQSLPESGLFRLTHLRNTGAAFGLFQGQSTILTLISLAGLIALMVYIFLTRHKFSFLYAWLARLALGLVLGGIIGNLTDRLRFGYVTDFIDVGIWPAFNIADSAIVVGTIIFAYSLYLSSRAPASK